MKPVTLFKKTTGLNNAVEPYRLQHNFSTGEVELAAAYNVDIDVSGNIGRRKGLTATARTESVHSLFCDGGDCFFVTGTSLYRLNADYTRTGVRSGMTAGAWISFLQLFEKTYYMNGFESGYIVNGISYAWDADPYVGPVTYKIFSDPPIGTLLTHLNGRIYIAKNDVLWYTENFGYNWVDLARNFIPFGQQIRMLRAVSGGIYVGLDKIVIFLKGSQPSDFVYKVISDSPVVTRTDVYAAGEQIGNGDINERVVVWTAQDGIYLGQPDGTVKNMSLNRLNKLSNSVGCAVYSNKKYLTLLQ